ncbi:hypothetical protein ALC53_06407 [Atta colombica]|uniref:Uncharacterized protein n=1 Tax=Atta colombica TaxID=520822 RepID=A0A195BG48_9HYME|nr:hypothetical protein ALC53_06407 [Atta colombica]
MNRGRNNGRTRVRKRRPCPFKKSLRNVSRPCIVAIATRVYDQTDKTYVVRGSHEEQEDVSTYEKTQGRSRRDGDWSEKRKFSNRSIPIGERDSHGGSRDAPEYTLGVPFVDSLGVSLEAEGSLKILSCNGVDVTPVERVQRWEDTLWKARLARP